jgi:hypothetical protein
LTTAVIEHAWGSPGKPLGGLARVTWSNGVAVMTSAILAPLVKRLGDETIRRGYDLRRGVCGGYNVRPIRGTTNRWSAHAFGAAVDLNWDRNPMATTLVTDMPPWMIDLWESHGFLWGGRYRTRKDAMHYEVRVPPGEVRTMIERLGVTSPSPVTQPRHRVVAPAPVHPGNRGPAVVQLQNMLRFLGIGHITVADGVYGPQTQAAVKALQTSLHVGVDGDYGPRSAAAFQAWLDTH